jgi:hypothetical protein
MRTVIRYVLVIVALVGCTRQLAHRFESDTGCPAGDTTREKLGAGLFEVRGCGHAIRYVCGQYACVQESSRSVSESSSESSSEPSSTSRSAPTITQDARPPEGVSTGRATDGTLGVRLTLHGGSASVALLLIVVPSVDPDRAHLRAMDVNGRPSRCATLEVRTTAGSTAVPLPDATLSVAALREQAESLVGFDLCGRQVRVSDQTSSLLQSFFETIESVRADPGSATDDDTVARERAVREHLDARRNAILACVGTDSAAVTARWSSDGAVSASIDGATANVDGCMRAAVGELRVAAGAAGELLHPVTR